MAISDKNLTCVECGHQFVFTVGEQEFFANQGYTNEPKRCTQCRETRKSRPRSGGESFRSSDREMHPAVCAQCGKNTTVPFLPRGDRPVYCSDCFSGMRTSNYR